MRYIILLLPVLLLGQSITTSVPLDDHSGSAATLPVTTGILSSIPVTCRVGQAYFATDATAGQNLYLCKPANNWTQVVGSGGGAVSSVFTRTGAVVATSGDYSVGQVTGAAPLASPTFSGVPIVPTASPGTNTGQAASTAFVLANAGSVGPSSSITDCKVAVSGAVATIPSPCSISLNGVVHNITSNATATLSGTSSTGTAYFYWDYAGNLTADQNTAATWTCNANCATAATGAVPANAFPLGSATFTANSFTGGTLTDLRSVYSSNPIIAGFGLTATWDGSGDLHLGIDNSVVLPLAGTTGSIGGGALTPPTCTSGTATITGVTTAMVVTATPVSYPGDGVYWEGYVSGVNTVTVKVCTVTAQTPSLSAYNVRVIQ